MGLKHIQGNSYYIDAPVCPGVYRADSGLILIDTGLEADSAKQIHKACSTILDPAGHAALPVAILNTHSHSDHCGGNAWFQKKYPDLEAYGPIIESVFIEHPQLEPLYLYGAQAYPELRQKFIQAQPSRIHHLCGPEPGTWHNRLQVAAVDMQLYFLSGHSVYQMAIVTPDRVAYIGDMLFGPALLQKHPLLFMYDYEATIAAFKRVPEMEADWFVLAHGGLLSREEVEDLAEANYQAVTGVHQTLYDFLRTPLTEIDLHQAYLSSRSIKETVPQYYLNLAVIKAHLSAMVQRGDVLCDMQGNTLYYQRA